MNRRIIDAAFEATVLMAAAAASVNTGALDLGENPDKIENVELEIDIDATTNLVNAKDIDVKIQDSADGSLWADVSVLADPVLKVTSSGGGSPRTRLQLAIPRSIRRYVRANVATETGGGDITANYATLRLLF